MTLDPDDDFLIADGIISVTAHAADGAPAADARIKKRWCASFLSSLSRLNVSSRSEQSTRSAQSSRLILKTAASVAMAVVATSGLSLSLAQTGAAVQILNGVKISRTPTVTADSGISETEKTWVTESISWQAKSRMQEIFITSDKANARKERGAGESGEAGEAGDAARNDENGALSDFPYSSTQIKDGRATCHIHLQGIDQVIQIALGGSGGSGTLDKSGKTGKIGDSRDPLSRDQEQRLRKIISQHEAAHCEMDVFEETPARKLNATWAQRKSELFAEPFTITALVGKERTPEKFSISEEILSLQAERYADAKALLIMVRDKTRGLGALSSPKEVHFSVQGIREDIEAVKRMRKNEVEMLDASADLPPLVYDHDTSAVIIAIESMVSKSPMSLSSASGFEISQIAGALATGSLMLERETLIQFALKRNIDQLKQDVAEESQSLKLLAKDPEYFFRQAKTFAKMSGQAAAGTPDEKLSLKERASSAQRAVDALMEKSTKGIDRSSDKKATEKVYAQVRLQMPASALALDSLDFSSMATIQKSLYRTRNENLEKSASHLLFLEKSLAEQALKGTAKWTTDLTSYVRTSQDVLIALTQGAELSKLVEMINSKPDQPQQGAINLGGFLGLPDFVIETGDSELKMPVQPATKPVLSPSLSAQSQVPLGLFDRGLTWTRPGDQTVLHKPRSKSF